MRTTKEISYSQFSTYVNCPFQWYQYYVLKNRPFSQNIYTIFGSAMHTTVQQFLQVMYNFTAKEATQMDLQQLFKVNLMEEYKKEKIKYNEWKNTSNENFLTVEELTEVYDDGIEILEYLKKHRAKYFKKDGWELVGVETKLNYPILENINFIGYVDVVLKEKKTNKLRIIDLKTSYMTWKKKKKEDPMTRAQLILYKMFYAKQFNITNLKDIDVEFLILKRKLYENCTYPQSRVQKVEPPSGTPTQNKHMQMFMDFITYCYIDNEDKKDWPHAKYVDSCKYCPFARIEDGICPKWNKKLLKG